MKNENDNITLDDLARLVTQNHEETQKRFDILEQGQEEIKRRLIRTVDAEKFYQLEERVSELEVQASRRTNI